MDDRTGKARAVSRDFYDETILANADIIDGERILLHAERPHVERRDVRGRLAVVTRRTVSVRKTIEVDVMHEEINVAYQLGDGTEIIAGGPQSFSILLHAEEVEIVKRVRVVGEVSISKKRIVEQQRYDIALRHERLDLLASGEDESIRSRSQ